jgi:hypothetical protein
MSTTRNPSIPVYVLTAVAVGTTTLAMLSLAISVSIFRRVSGGFDKDEGWKIEREYLELKESVPPKTIAEFERMALKKLAPLSRIYYQYFSDPSTTIDTCRAFYNSL